MNFKAVAVILAGGRGERFGGGVPKQFVDVQGKMIVEMAVDTFERCERIDEIVLVFPAGWIEFADNLRVRNGWKKVIKVIEGGKTRQESSFKGISAIDDEEAYVLIHDGARPFVSEEVINRVIDKLESGASAVITGVPSTDTVVRIEDGGIVGEVLDRNKIWLVQTPQGFLLSVIRKAHKLAVQEGVEDVSDDGGLVLRSGVAEVVVVEGDRKNVKITFREDLGMSL